MDRDGEPEREAALPRAKDEMDRAERELQTSAGDCATACRALGSMDRAARHLCDLAGNDDELDRCEEAKRKVLRARDRVRATCGICAGGPTVDRNAPVPSTSP